jgi:hypothetical protein
VNRLSTAALSYHTQCLAFLQSIRNTVDSVDHAIIGVEASHKIAKVEKDVSIPTNLVVSHLAPLDR